MSLVRGVEVVTLMLLPSALVALALQAPRGVDALERWVTQRRARRRGPWTSALPIERIAADLRRLLGCHAELVHRDDIPLRAHRLQALELAIAQCIDEAERALGLADRENASRDELRRRLQRLAAAGLVLPRQTSLLPDDGPS